jgi:glycosyltransferase involved in cell wall biosynthesis
MKEILEGDIGQFGLRGKAWLTPYCSNMPRAMNAIDCLVHPQIGTEAFPGVVLEAFACGKPVIASALDGIPEAFAAGGYGRLVKPEDVDELAGALIERTNQPALSEEQSTQLHDRIAEQFSLSVNARRVMELYERMINR